MISIIAKTVDNISTTLIFEKAYKNKTVVYTMPNRANVDEEEIWQPICDMLNMIAAVCETLPKKYRLVAFDNLFNLVTEKVKILDETNFLNSMMPKPEKRTSAV